MSDVTITASRTMPVAPTAIHTAIADYRRHHRPGGFLPPSFEDLEVLDGGVGAGTHIRMRVRLGRSSRVMEARISEPQPGRVLVESGGDTVTTFTLDPEGAGTRVTIDTRIVATGLRGWLTRRFAPGMLAPIYADELERLERYAAALPA
ncbi:MAG: SRPBCC family protein [Chloroflexota bacterium]